MLRKLVLNIDAQRISGMLYTLRAFNNEFYTSSRDIVDLANSWNKLLTYAEISFSSKHWRLWTGHLQELKFGCRIGSLFWIASQKDFALIPCSFVHEHDCSVYKYKQKNQFVRVEINIKCSAHAHTYCSPQQLLYLRRAASR